MKTPKPINIAWAKRIIETRAKELGFKDVESMRHAQLAADMAADPADSLMAEETGEIDPPHPMADFAARVLRDIEAERQRRLQRQDAADSLNRERINTAADRLALGRRLYREGMSGTDLRKAYAEAGEMVSQRTAERDLKNISS